MKSTEQALETLLTAQNEDGSLNVQVANTDPVTIDGTVSASATLTGDGVNDAGELSVVSRGGSAANQLSLFTVTPAVTLAVGTPQEVMVDMSGWADRKMLMLVGTGAAANARLTVTAKIPYGSEEEEPIAVLSTDAVPGVDKALAVFDPTASKTARAFIIDLPVDRAILVFTATEANVNGIQARLRGFPR